MEDEDWFGVSSGEGGITSDVLYNIWLGEREGGGGMKDVEWLRRGEVEGMEAEEWFGVGSGEWGNNQRCVMYSTWLGEREGGGGMQDEEWLGKGEGRGMEDGEWFGVSSGEAAMLYVYMGWGCKKEGE